MLRLLGFLSDDYFRSIERLNLSKKKTHPEVLLLEAGNPSVGRPHLVDKLEKRVQVVEAADALVQRRHHLVGVLRQLLGRGLLLLCFELFELGEHVQQVGVFLE